MDSVKLAVVSNCLENGAKTWYRVASPTITSWEEFKVKARKQFVLLHQQRHLRTELKALRQAQNKTTSTYVDKFRSIAMLIANMSDEDMIYTFMGGLHPAAQMQVNFQDPQTLEGAMNIAIAYDQAYCSAQTEGHKFSRRSDSERKNQGQRQTNGVTRMVTKELEAISKTTYPR
jgi:hypothetical protein